MEQPHILTSFLLVFFTGCQGFPSSKGLNVVFPYRDEQTIMYDFTTHSDVERQLIYRLTINVINASPLEDHTLILIILIWCWKVCHFSLVFRHFELFVHFLDFFVHFCTSFSYVDHLSNFWSFYWSLCSVSLKFFCFVNHLVHCFWLIFVHFLDYISPFLFFPLIKSTIQHVLSFSNITRWKSHTAVWSQYA